MLLKSALLALTAAAHLVAGHGAIVKAVGDQGGEGTALGIDASTSRDGSKRDPFQQDSTGFKNAAANDCSETLSGGTNNPTAQIPQMLTANGGSMPQISPGGMWGWDEMGQDACTGSMAAIEGVCMVGCDNAADAGPFGGCVPVQMVGAGNATALLQSQLPEN
ncbi:hypothetical protein G7Y89_g6184 [Cudoniella acicularis]|uniref:Uncharacterized protein n=1 Tax=Cudoniella acicularis TaxID=354080 RepID=A0A8H4RL11_9HELO|nr:hypothetical protein G7Y89_g6184 [Cudoniella acicularis]